MTNVRRLRKLYLGGGIALTFTLCAGAAWNWFHPPQVTAQKRQDEAPSTSAPTESVTRIKAVPVRREDLSIRKEATGYLDPWRVVEVAAESGGRVVQSQVSEGQWVGSSELLVLLDDRERLLEVQEAEAERLKIRAQYAVNFESGPPPGAAAGTPEELYRQGLISKQDLFGARGAEETAHLLSGRRQGEIRAATSGLAQAEQRLARARLALDRTRIVAPFGGRVADLAVEPGQQVASGQPLLTLLDDSRLRVEVSVLEADVVRLREGAPARMRIPALNNLSLDGAVHTINPRIDPETGTGRVTVTLPNPRGRLMPGLFAYVELETGRLASRLLVPAPAVLERQDRQLVFRVMNGRALWTYVKTGARSGELVEILDGLAEGDLVAVANHFALAHEAPVELEE